jgi:hypothetical protein
MRRTIPLCLFNRHEPDRTDINWDGLNYVSCCSNCGVTIRRKSRRKWLREWMPQPVAVRL